MPYDFLYFLKFYNYKILIYKIFVLYPAEEAVHPEIAVSSGQGTDNKTRLLSLTFVIYIKTTHLVAIKERSKCCFSSLFVDACRAILNYQIHLLSQILVQFLGVSFLKRHDHAHRYVLCEERSYSEYESGHP